MELQKLKSRLLKEERQTLRKRRNNSAFRWLAGFFLLLVLAVSAYVWHANRDDADQMLFSRAEKLIDKGKYLQAVIRLQSLAEHFPATDNAPRALLLAGDVLLLNLKREQEALLSYLLLERDYPESDWCRTARHRVADIYKYRLHDYGRALVAYQKILDGKAADGEKIQYEIADTYFRMDNLEQTRIEFESLLGDYPDSALASEALYRIGAAFFLEGKLTDAVPVLTRLCADYPDSSFAMEGTFTLAQIHEERGDLRKALEILENIEDTYPRKSVVTQRIKQIQQRMKKKKQAI